MYAQLRGLFCFILILKMENKRLTELEKCTIAKERGIAYNSITGELFNTLGDLISRKDKDGYIYVLFTIKKHAYKIMGHRYAWFLHYGELPKNVIDHIDGNSSNNKIENLRDVTHQQNTFNRKKAKGYSQNKHTKNFEVRIRYNNVKYYLGCFKSEEDARNAYLEAKNIYHIIPTSQTN